MNTDPLQYLFTTAPTKAHIDQAIQTIQRILPPTDPRIPPHHRLALLKLWADRTGAHLTAHHIKRVKAEPNTK